jgi:hypothetical protein
MRTRLTLPTGWISVLVAALGVGAALVPASASAGTIDQQQPNAIGLAYSPYGTTEYAQTYTAGVSGQQDEIDLLIDRHSAFCDPSPPGVTVQIMTVDGAGRPSGTILASAVIPSSSPPGETGFAPPPAMTSAIFSSPPTVSAGSRYAIVATTPASLGCYNWWENIGNPYQAGERFDSPDGGGTWSAPAPDADFAFKTYVVPTPPMPPTPPSATTSTPVSPRKRCKHTKRHKSGAVIAKKCKRKRDH